MRLLITLLAVISLSGCLGMPEQVKPITGFDLDRYLGTWYEIARLDHSFERGLEQVSANYSLRDDGGVRVVNRGYSVSKQQWEQANGKAYFVNEADEAYLKVSFFGPFYGSYVIFDIDRDNYEYVFISGPNHSYLWLLARTPTVPQAVIDKFVQQAKARGFATEKLIFVKH